MRETHTETHTETTEKVKNENRWENHGPRSRRGRASLATLASAGPGEITSNLSEMRRVNHEQYLKMGPEIRSNLSVWPHQQKPPVRIDHHSQVIKQQSDSLCCSRRPSSPGTAPHTSRQFHSCRGSGPCTGCELLFF